MLQSRKEKVDNVTKKVMIYITSHHHHYHHHHHHHSMSQTPFDTDSGVCKASVHVI